MQNKLTIQHHDINKKCDNLNQKFQHLLEVVDINDFFEKSLDFLSAFKSIIDNNKKSGKKLRQNAFGMYVINLRNYQQHHESEYQDSIQKNSGIRIGGNAILLDSNSYLSAGKIICNGNSAENVQISLGRTLSIDGGDTLERRFEITNPFNFSYKFDGKTYFGYDKTPPAPNFYQILSTATNVLITQMKKTSK
jgi:hypothetical protein